MAKGKVTPNLPRFVKPEGLCIGDTIRVTWTQGDVEHSVVGTMRDRQHEFNYTEYATANGNMLLTTFSDGTTEPAGARVTLLTREAQAGQLTLSGLEV